MKGNLRHTETDGWFFKSPHLSSLQTSLFRSLMANFSLSCCLEVSPISFVATSVWEHSSFHSMRVCLAACHFILANQSVLFPCFWCVSVLYMVEQTILYKVKQGERDTTWDRVWMQSRVLTFISLLLSPNKTRTDFRLSPTAKKIWQAYFSFSASRFWFGSQICL